MTPGVFIGALAWLERWWFAPSTRYQLGVFRVFLLGWLGWFYSERQFARLELIAGRPLDFYEPLSLARWLSLGPPPDLATVQALKPWLIALVAMGLVGLLTRPVLLLLAALNLVLGLWVNGWGYTAHASALPTIVLLIVACAPGVTSFSLDALLLPRLLRRLGLRGPEALPRRAVSVWPVHAILLVMSLLYFSAGLSKLRYSGWQWTDGNTLAFYLGGGSLRGAEEVQRFIVDRDAPRSLRFRDGWGIVDHAWVGRPTPLGSWASRDQGLLRVLSTGAILWELLFPLALVAGWPRRLALLGGLSFHACISWTLNINFSAYLVCYLVFIDWSCLARLGCSLATRSLTLLRNMRIQSSSD